MRAIWKGSIAFGLVNVPVKLYSATEDHDIGLHQVHSRDGGRIRYQRKCEVCGEVVAYEDIDKAYEEEGRTVILTSEELKSLPEESSREIEVVEFVPAEQLDPLTYERSYYLEPDSASPKAYTLLRRTLQDTDRVAIVQFALRQKTRLGALRVRGDVLVLQGLLWADEVREASFPSLEASVTVTAKEREMSAALVDSMSQDFDPEHYTDNYQAQLRLLIEAKLEKGESLDTEETFGAPAAAEGGEVIDLMEALKRSLDKKRAGKGASAESAEEDDGGTAASGTRKTASRSTRSTSSRSAAKPASKSATSGSRSSSRKTSQPEEEPEAERTPARRARAKKA
ncbi:Ku protein [Arthrobacter sp. M4]|uniref:non-homologous end joining protein Ku n=1 Tax=Arthrobacter sp. M4 TaxID=218160 RepID=UPI001CDC63F8|nr:Ku protein [Arthrobacter sp. M4]MCA4134138.1 Ku protein [Arthrobacter sp. M4]